MHPVILPSHFHETDTKFSLHPIAPSKHSRAARRATSPSIDTDKSLKNAKLPSEPAAHRPSILGLHQAAGVSKKTKRGRKTVLSSKARRRQEKGLDRAAAVMERTAQKVDRSWGQAKAMKGRKKAWEEINKGEAKGGKKPRDDDDEEGRKAVEAIYGETDEEMEELEGDDDDEAVADGAAAAAAAATKVDGNAGAAIDAASVPLPAAADDDDDDDIL